jgi:hypothetical protein
MSRYEQERDNKFCCIRVPLVPVGFAIMVYGSVVGWVFGAIWGALGNHSYNSSSFIYCYIHLLAIL